MCKSTGVRPDHRTFTIVDDPIATHARAKHLRQPIRQRAPSHRFGHRDVSFKAKRFRHRVIAPHQVAVGNMVAAGAGQQRA